MVSLNAFPISISGSIVMGWQIIMITHWACADHLFAKFEVEYKSSEIKMSCLQFEIKIEADIIEVRVVNFVWSVTFWTPGFMNTLFFFRLFTYFHCLFTHFLFSWPLQRGTAARIYLADRLRLPLGFFEKDLAIASSHNN